MKWVNPSELGQRDAFLGLGRDIWVRYLDPSVALDALGGLGV